jgi:hypothetical protein
MRSAHPFYISRLHRSLLPFSTCHFSFAIALGRDSIDQWQKKNGRWKTENETAAKFHFIARPIK